MPISTTILTPNNPQYSTTGPWSAYAGAWGASSLTYGVDYTQSITLNNTTFPNGTLFSWSFPLYGGPFGVWSYPCIVYGSTPELINSTVPSTQVANFVNLSTSYSAVLTVNSGQLDTIFDIWLTSQPYGGVSTVKYELEIVPQTDWQYSPLTYTLTDSTLDNAAVYVDPGKIIVVPSSEMLTGTISISDILKSMIWNGVITGQEYISGIEFGPEPGSGSGSLLVNSLNYQWTSTSTVQLTAGNDTFEITTPGGNDIEGNGGLDTVIYSGLYSQFQIKTLGSETLVTENNNISTLDYLQGITFVQFSNGRYNTETSTFTPATVIQVDGSTSLTEIGNNYFLFDSSGSGPELKYAGAAVTAGEFGGWVPIGAVQTASGYDIAWMLPGANQYTVWSTDSNGNYQSNIIAPVPGNSLALESLELTFNQDLNGDGVIGPTKTVIQTDTNPYGSISLVEVANTYDLEGSSGSGPELKYAGAAVTAGEFGGWVPIGAVQTASGYDIAWMLPGANQYTAWSTDSNGNYQSNIFSPVSANSLALESLELTFNQDLNGDGVIGPTKTVIQTDTNAYGSISLVEVANTYDLEGSSGSGPELKYAGAAVTAGEFGGFVPIGAVQTASGYDIAWMLPGANQYTVWSTDSNGNYQSNIFSPVSANSLALESLELTFNQDLNGDGVIGPTKTVIQTDTNPYGSISLVEVANTYDLEGSSGSGPELKYAGAAVTAGEFGGWVPIGAVQTASGYDIAWMLPGANQYTAWSTDSNGNYQSNIFSPVSANSLALELLELTFNQDLNGDGVIGPTKTVIQTDTNAYGSISLVEVANTYDLEGSSGSGPELKYAGAAVTAGEFGGFVPIGAVQTASGYDIAWMLPGANQYTVWSTDSNGNYQSNIFSPVSANSLALELLELTFNQDLNGDGVIGPTKTVIQTDTNAYGSISLVEVANTYDLEGSSGSGPELKYAGAAVTAGEFGGWVPIGAVQTASGYDIAWMLPGANQYTAWSTDSNGNYQSNIFSPVSANSLALESLELTFNQDLNGDGVIGIYAVPGTTLQISQPLSGTLGASTIGAGATFELAAADSGPVTFSASTGMLKLDNPSTFTGEIFNFTGNGSLSGSDQIDLTTINYGSVHDSYANGILTVTDGTDSVALHFNGSYTLANFEFASDGSGGTIVYDPPVSNAPNSGTATIATDTSNDAFIFPSNLGQTINPDHQTAPGNLFGTEPIHFNNVNFGSPTLAGAMHDANESPVVSDVTHDAIHVHNALAQLHHAGFLI